MRAWLVIALFGAIACSSKSTPTAETGSAERPTDRPANRPADLRIEPRTQPEPPRPPRTRSGARAHSTVDVRALSLACKADTDCTLVDVSPCNRCTCASVAISKAGERAFSDAAAAVRCEGWQLYPCVDCEAVVAVCSEGECTTRSTEPVPQGGECQTDRDCVVSCAEEGRCCPEAVCETTIPRAKAAAIIEANRARCSPEALAACPRPESTEYIQPRCRRGKCFGEFLER